MRNWEREALAVSDQLTLLKSNFQAYAVPVPSAAKDHDANDPSLPSRMKTLVVPSLLEHLNAVQPRTRRASHAMYAWRICQKQGPMLYGSSNGGEAGAGERLERLLELGHCEDVIVVVFRWYGGVKLGSDRWKCISSVAKEALERGGFMRPPGADPADAHSPATPKRGTSNKKRR
ncbi:ribosomal protein S5 domain 2-type protein [Trametes elegans]|nr:ribosomal protein S5 domain 2-type protein [Trametes elegans]